MNTDQATRLMRQRLAKTSALADIGRAQSQLVSQEALLEGDAMLRQAHAEIDRLQERLSNQARTIKVMESTIVALRAELEERA